MAQGDEQAQHRGLELGEVQPGASHAFISILLFYYDHYYFCSFVNVAAVLAILPDEEGYCAHHPFEKGDEGGS